MKFSFPQDCGNSPKRELIKNICLAVVNNDMAKFYSHLADDIIWEFVENVRLSGKQEVKDFYEKNRTGQVEGMVLDYILTHGKQGSARGNIILSARSIHFADFYEFASAKCTLIIKMKSLVLRDTGDYLLFL